MNRRQFVGALALSAFAQPAAPRVNAARLRGRLEALSVFGRPAGGTFADGVSRYAYSDADVAGRAYVMKLMEGAGLKPRIDAAGNIFGRRAGTQDSLPPVLFGSHIDSVPNGGNFDGDLGSLGAIEVVETLNEARVTTRRPLEVVVWQNEEGFAFNNGLVGSRAAAGHLDPGELDAVWNGTKKSDAIRKIGGAPERIAEAVRRPGSFACYLELHIEQGGVLEKGSVDIGVVEGIVAIDRYDVEIRGFANHAGTTPMAERHDALVAASHVTIAVDEMVRGEAGCAGGDGGAAYGESECAEHRSRNGAAGGGTARSLVEKDRPHRGEIAFASARDRGPHQDGNRHARGGAPRCGAGHARGAEVD